MGVFFMLKGFFEENPRVAVAFSGGADSAYLLSQAVKYAQSVLACCVKTDFNAEHELEDAVRLAEELGAELEVIPVDILSDERVAANDPLRCYYCKTRLLGAVKERAAAAGYDVVVEGSNFDDDPAGRPGMKALSELGIRSPIREAGLNKAEVRRLSREAGLFTWNKPSNSCAATRIPTGTRVEAEMLDKIKAGEKALHELGFSELRLRWRKEGAKLELPESQIATAVEKRDDILAALGGDFKEITLDLKGRDTNG